MPEGEIHSSASLTTLKSFPKSTEELTQKQLKEGGGVDFSSTHSEIPSLQFYFLLAIAATLS